MAKRGGFISTMNALGRATDRMQREQARQDKRNRIAYERAQKENASRALANEWTAALNKIAEAEKGIRTATSINDMVRSRTHALLLVDALPKSRPKGVSGLSSRDLKQQVDNSVSAWITGELPRIHKRLIDSLSSFKTSTERKAAVDDFDYQFIIGIHRLVSADTRVAMSKNANYKLLDDYEESLCIPLY